MVTGTVNVVHAIDTEGPIYESVQATFERLEEILGVKIKPSLQNLKKLRKKEIKLETEELKNRAADFVSETKLNYLSTWSDVEKMVKKISQPNIRSRIKDTFGGSWICSWFCLDLVGFKNNPRKKDLGFHNVFDKYNKLKKNLNLEEDELQFHFHPMSTYKDAHRFATSFINSPDLYPSLARKIIERNVRVEGDKAWEISWMRRLFIASVTYVLAALYMNSVGLGNPFFGAIVPSGGYLLSTMSLPFIKKYWINHCYKNQESK